MVGDDPLRAAALRTQEDRAVDDAPGGGVLPLADELHDAPAAVAAFVDGHGALVVPVEQLEAEARLDRVNRRAFLGLSALAVTHGALATEMAASIAGSDPVPLARVQTTHGADVVTASLTDKATTANLRRWMLDGDVPILRVNAAGILAKLPGQGQADQVARVLAHDEEPRHLYLTAVTSRVCAVDWTTAGRIVSQPAAYGHWADFLATRFAREALNPRDSGARWCSSVMLRELSPMIGRSPR